MTVSPVANPPLETAVGARYIVVEISGWRIEGSGRTTKSGPKHGVSFSVPDTLNNHQEVFCRYHGDTDHTGQSRGYVERRRQSYRECERLNNLSRIYDGLGADAA